MKRFTDLWISSQKLPLRQIKEKKKQVNSRSAKTKSAFKARKENFKFPNKKRSILRKHGVEGQYQHGLRV
jgi:hypothetical protein